MAHRDRFAVVDGLELRYVEWGSPDDPTVVCVHGLSRVGRDFDPLASALADEFHVVCPDLPGRGLSEWAARPDHAYTGRALADRCVAFCDHLDLEALRWVGTSMGGSLGIELAAGALADRITHLVLNDVGPEPVEDAAADEGIDRIIDYLTNPPVVDRLTALEAYYRETYGSFSPMTAAEWRRFTVTSCRRTQAGSFVPAYDTRAVEPLLTEDSPIAQWDRWDAVAAPTLVLTGARSDILTDSTLDEMRVRRPAITTRTYDCGHAPALNVPSQIEPIDSFFRG